MYEFECLTEENVEEDYSEETCSPFYGECYPVGCEPGSCAPA